VTTSPANPLSRFQSLISWALLLALLMATFVWARRPDAHGIRPGIGGGDFGSYLLVGKLALEGGHIYDDAGKGVNTWPPFFSLLCIPLALLGRPTPYLARIAWLALNYLLLWEVLRILARLIYQREISWWMAPGKMSLLSREICLPLLICARFILSNFEHLQIQIVLFSLTVLALDLHARGRALAGGIWLGFVAALKVMPIVFIPYLLFRRQWRFAFTATIATAAFSLSPVFVYGTERFIDYVAAWHGALQTGWSVGKMNQSVFAMIDRSIGYDVTPWNVNARNSLTALRPGAAMFATLCLVGIVIIFAVRLLRGKYSPDSWLALLDYGIVFIASAIFGPVAWKSYFVVLLFPTTVLVGLIRREILSQNQRRVATLVLLLFFALTAMPSQALVGQAFAWGVEMLSGPVLGSLGLLAYLLWLHPRLANNPIAFC
jgi:hypothetical protein